MRTLTEQIIYDFEVNKMEISAIAEKHNLSADVVRFKLGTNETDGRKEKEQPVQELKSSLAKSITNHTPGTAQVLAIEAIRKAADDLCLVIDGQVLDSREKSLAKTHLEETVMWAVKAVILGGL